MAFENLVVTGIHGLPKQSRSSTLSRPANTHSLPTASSRRPFRISLHFGASTSTVFQVAKSIEARSLEVNPLVVTANGRVVAADCRVTVDDYAVFRHPELGIDIARELDHPPTALEKVAYAVEQADQRGTFYFAVVATNVATGGIKLAGTYSFTAAPAT